MPDLIKMPVSPPQKTVRAGSFFIVQAQYPTEAPPRWAWGCHDCDASGTATSPDDLGRQLTDHHQKCTDSTG